MKKTINAEAKAMLQLSSSARNMDLKCPQGNRPTEKEEKDSGRKNRSIDSAFVDTSSGKRSSST